jgi:hypothetical protein
MAEMKAMAEKRSKLEAFLRGNNWSQRYARISLPVLVRWSEEEKAAAPDEHHEYTYKELAIAVGQPKHAHPIHEALGVLGFALQDLSDMYPKEFDGKIPPIQLLVWSKGMGRPGDDAFWFIDITKEKLKELPEPARKLLAQQTRAQIINYPHWRAVLNALNLEPLTISLPEPESVTTAPGFRGYGGGERDEHKRLKHYLADHYQLLGISGVCEPVFEEVLLSGDRIDLLLIDISGKRRISVEVKSRISDDNDLIRGLFQCVKYKAVLNAHETYEAARNANWSPNKIRVILATERPLPSGLQELSDLLGIRAVTVRVPDGYSIPLP